jgi:hypothetical protein
VGARQGEGGPRSGTRARTPEWRRGRACAWLWTWTQRARQPWVCCAGVDAPAQDLLSDLHQPSLTKITTQKSRLLMTYLFLDDARPTVAWARCLGNNHLNSQLIIYIFSVLFPSHPLKSCPTTILSCPTTLRTASITLHRPCPVSNHHLHPSPSQKSSITLIIITHLIGIYSTYTHHHHRGSPCFSASFCYLYSLFGRLQVDTSYSYIILLFFLPFLFSLLSLPAHVFK